MATLSETFSVKSFIVRMSRTQHEREEPFFHCAGPSLEGMERHVPSFQQFLKTVPPPPSRTPATIYKDDSAASTPSWWEFDGGTPTDRRRSYFLQPSTYTASTPNSSKSEEPAAPPPLEPRRFQPLLDTALTTPRISARLDEARAFDYERAAEFPADRGLWKQSPPTPWVSDSNDGNPSVSPLSPMESELAKFPQPPAFKAPPVAEQPGEQLDKQDTAQPRSDAVITLNLPNLNVKHDSVSMNDVSPLDLADQNTPTVKHSRKASVQTPIPHQGLDLSSQRSGPWPVSPDNVCKMQEIEDVTDYHKALADQYRDLVQPAPAIFEDDAPSPPKGAESDVDDKKMVPQPLFWTNPAGNQHRRGYSEDSYRVHEQKGRDKHQRKASLRDQIRERLPSVSSGPLKMILPSQSSKEDVAAPLPSKHEIENSPKERKLRKERKPNDSPPISVPLKMMLPSQYPKEDAVALLRSKSEFENLKDPLQGRKHQIDNSHSSDRTQTSSRPPTVPVRPGSPLSLAWQFPGENARPAAAFKAFPPAEDRRRRQAPERPTRPDEVRSKSDEPRSQSRQKHSRSRERSESRNGMRERSQSRQAGEIRSRSGEARSQTPVQRSQTPVQRSQTPDQLIRTRFTLSPASPPPAFPPPPPPPRPSQPTIYHAPAKDAIYPLAMHRARPIPQSISEIFGDASASPSPTSGASSATSRSTSSAAIRPALSSATSTAATTRGFSNPVAVGLRKLSPTPPSMSMGMGMSMSMSMSSLSLLGRGGNTTTGSPTSPTSEDRDGASDGLWNAPRDAPAPRDGWSLAKKAFLEGRRGSKRASPRGEAEELLRERRRRDLKSSIKVVGTTDPCNVGGYA